MGCGTSGFAEGLNTETCTSYSEVSSALAAAGVGDIQLCVAFDFSITFTERTAEHACQALSAIVEGLGETHSTRKTLAYGFGELHTESQTVFSFHEERRPCNNLAECVQRFHEIRKAATPHGHASLAPLIHETLRCMGQAHRHHVLTIMVQNDLHQGMKATKAAIEEACQFGLSILIIGIGQNDWKGFRKLQHRNVQFIQVPDSAAISEVAFVATAVKKIPGQYRTGKLHRSSKPDFDSPCYSPPDRSTLGDPWHRLPSGWDAYWDKERDLTVYINMKTKQLSLIPPVLQGMQSSRTANTPPSSGKCARLQIKVEA